MKAGRSRNRVAKESVRGAVAVRREGETQAASLDDTGVYPSARLVALEAGEEDRKDQRRGEIATRLNKTLFRLRQAKILQ